MKQLMKTAESVLSQLELPGKPDETPDDTSTLLMETYWKMMKQLMKQLIKTDDADETIDEKLIKLMKQLMKTYEHWWHNCWKLKTADDDTIDEN